MPQPFQAPGLIGHDGSGNTAGIGQCRHTCHGSRQIPEISHPQRFCRHRKTHVVIPRFLVQTNHLAVFSAELRQQVIDIGFDIFRAVYQSR
jgi:hypothetical protein